METSVLGVRWEDGLCACECQMVGTEQVRMRVCVGLACECMLVQECACEKKSEHVKQCI